MSSTTTSAKQTSVMMRHQPPMWLSSPRYWNASRSKRCTRATNPSTTKTNISFFIVADTIPQLEVRHHSAMRRYPSLSKPHSGVGMSSVGLALCTLVMRTDRLLPAPVHDVTHCQDGVTAKHARPGVAHDGPDLVSHGWLEAMHRALGASGLPFLEGAFLKTLVGVGQQIAALGADPATSMLSTAVDAYHDGDGPAFPGHSGMSLAHCGHIVP